MGIPAAGPRYGKAHIETCPDCRPRIDPACPDCEGTGQIIYKACPRCGDLGWAYRNGRNDRAGMTCQLGCGHTWSASDPGWQIQQRAAPPPRQDSPQRS